MPSTKLADLAVLVVLSFKQLVGSGCYGNVVVCEQCESRKLLS
jgi:hypothetical protein